MPQYLVLYTPYSSTMYTYCSSAGGSTNTRKSTCETSNTQILTWDTTLLSSQLCSCRSLFESSTPTTTTTSSTNAHNATWTHTYKCSSTATPTKTTTTTTTTTPYHVMFDSVHDLVIIGVNSNDDASESCHR